MAAVVWSPLGWGRLTGKLRRGQPQPEISRLPFGTIDSAPPVADEALSLFVVVEAIDRCRRPRPGRALPQIAINWLLQRPTVANVIIGARNEAQLLDNLGAVGWNLTAEQIKKLDAASATAKPYPYWHQSGFSERNPPPV